MYITEDYLGAFFFDFGPMEEVSTVNSKSGFVTCDVELIVMLIPNRFNGIPSLNPVHQYRRRSNTRMTHPGCGPGEWAEEMKKRTKARNPPP